MKQIKRAYVGTESGTCRSVFCCSALVLFSIIMLTSSPGWAAEILPSQIGQNGQHGENGTDGAGGERGARGINTGIRDGQPGSAGGNGGNGGNGGDGGDGNWYSYGAITNNGSIKLGGWWGASNSPSFTPYVPNGSNGSDGIAGGNGGSGGFANWPNTAAGSNGICTSGLTGCTVGTGAPNASIEGGDGTGGGGGGGGASSSLFFSQQTSNGGWGSHGLGNVDLSLGQSGANGAHGTDGADEYITTYENHTVTGIIQVGGTGGRGGAGGDGGNGGGGGGGSGGAGSLPAGSGGDGGAKGSGGSGGSSSGWFPEGMMVIRREGSLVNNSSIEIKKGNGALVTYGDLINNGTIQRVDSFRGFVQQFANSGGNVTNAAGGRMLDLDISSSGEMRNEANAEIRGGSIQNSGTFINEGITNSVRLYKQAGNTAMTILNTDTNISYMEIRGGILKGGVEINGNLTINGSGVLSPGNEIGILTVNGSLSIEHDPNSGLPWENGPPVTEFQIGGLVRGDEYDALIVAGWPSYFDPLVQLDGILDVSWFGDFRAASGDSFDILDWPDDPYPNDSWPILSGEFTTINLPELQLGLEWDISSLYLDGTLAVTVNAVPIPGALLLMGSGLFGLLVVDRRKRCRSLY